MKLIYKSGKPWAKQLTRTLFNNLVTVLINLNRDHDLKSLSKFLKQMRIQNCAKQGDDLVRQIDNNDLLNVNNVSAYIYQLWADELEYRKMVSYCEHKQRVMPAFAWASFHSLGYYDNTKHYPTRDTTWVNDCLIEEGLKNDAI